MQCGDTLDENDSDDGSDEGDAPVSTAASKAGPRPQVIVDIGSGRAR